MGTSGIRLSSKSKSVDGAGSLGGADLGAGGAVGGGAGTAVGEGGGGGGGGGVVGWAGTAVPFTAGDSSTLGMVPPLGFGESVELEEMTSPRGTIEAPPSSAPSTSVFGGADFLVVVLALALDLVRVVVFLGAAVVAFVRGLAFSSERMASSTETLAQAPLPESR